MDMDVLEKLQERRTVTLNDNINQEQAANLGHRLLELALESDEEIRLLIDSDGGNVQPALSICDVIASIKAPVIGIVIGRCFSMAVVILQAPQHSRSAKIFPKRKFAHCSIVATSRAKTHRQQASK
jgi:ATP-dependent Clp protease protease subunit